MRVSPTALLAAFVLAGLLFASGPAKAADVTTDSAPVTGAVAQDADVNAWGVRSAGDQDPQGKILYVWLWILPISAVVSLVGYVYVNDLVNRNFALAKRRRSETP